MPIILGWRKAEHTQNFTDPDYNPRNIVARYRISCRNGRRVITYRGLYLFCHINGPTALSMQYAVNTMAFVVTFLVCPAVVCDTQAKAKTKLVTPIPDHMVSNDPTSERSVVRTCYPESK